MEPRAYKGEEKKKQSGPRISELMPPAGDTLIVLERTEQTTKLFRIDLSAATDIVGRRQWDDAATLPTLEQIDPAKDGLKAGAQDAGAGQRRP